MTQQSDYGLPWWPTYRRFVWSMVVLIVVNPAEGMQRLREVGYGLVIAVPLIVGTIIYKNRYSDEPD
jgi:uncharacterized membrane protein YfhO